MSLSRCRASESASRDEPMSPNRQRIIATGFGLAAVAALALLPFVPRSVLLADNAKPAFNGTSLAGWHSWGRADWRAQDGEVVGAVAQNGTGGWLVSDGSWQDLVLKLSFRCTGGCEF